jgi:hypothetical protein
VICMSVKDVIMWKAHWKLVKFKDPHDDISRPLKAGVPLETMLSLVMKEELIGIEEWDDNVALNTGITELLNIITGNGSPIKWDHADSSLGVGDSATGEGAGDTNLKASSNKKYNAMDTNYPTVSNQTATWQSTFATGDANYAWQEYVICNKTDGTGVCLNRKTASKGTKASGETWTLQVTITPA